jgi:glycosyltransferase involved in cell wall biosynthesis
MHIAYLTSEYPPFSSGGIGTFIRNLGQSLVQQGHRVTVLSWGAHTDFEDRGIHVRFIEESGVPKFGWFLNQRRMEKELNRMVREDGLEIVEAPDWCGLSAGLRVDCPVVIRCHGTDTYFASLLGRSVRPSVRWMEWLALHRAASVVAVSRFTSETTARLFGLRQPVKVIPNGIDTGRFRPARFDEVEPGTILYLGTLVRKKGVLDLCRIFSLLVQKYPQARLLLVGRDGADQQTGSASTWELCEGLLSSSARRRAEYLGPQPYDRVQDYVRRAAICAFPSYAEAMPLSWLEVMACAKPIVAYDIGWASEVVEHEQTGLLVPAGALESFANALVQLLADEEMRNNMSEESRCRASSRFSSGIVAARSLKWYAQQVSSRQPETITRP